MATRMTHPRHGVTFAVGSEVEWNQKNGWTVEAKPVPALPDEPEMSDGAKLEDARRRYSEMYGKPPHHRLGLEKILNALSS